MSNATTVSVECGRCSGSGRFFFGPSESGDCYGCGGRGKVRMSAARYAQVVVKAAQAVERYAACRAEDQAEDQVADAAYHAACAAVDADGVEGARRYFAANRANRVALMALVHAMRDLRTAEWDARSNAVVAHIRAL